MTRKQFSVTLKIMESPYQHRPSQSNMFKPKTMILFSVLALFIVIVSGRIGYILGERARQNRASPPVEMNESWQTYQDVKLGAIFEYPTTWKVIHKTTDNSITGKGRDYRIVFDDTTVPGNKVNFFISSINNPENLSLADFYRRYHPGGIERFVNISFQETVNPHGVRFEKIVRPYTNPDYSPLLETLHNYRVYEISATIPISLWFGMPLDSNYRQEPTFQKALTGYNHLINTFLFMQ